MSTESKAIPPRVIDITGQPFVRLTVVEFAGVDPVSRLAMWRCDCSCGGSKITSGRNLRSGIAVSCGCRMKETLAMNRKTTGHVTHGLSKTVEYNIWASMIGRCENESNPQYLSYGARGISVCDEWRDSFEVFYDDMGQRPASSGRRSRFSLERKDNDGPYCKDNCVWETHVNQSRNKRNNHVIELNGKSMCLAGWAEHTGIDSTTLRKRFKLGWSVEKALTHNVRRRSHAS